MTFRVITKFNNKKVVFIMGATGMGKSRLSVNLATHFRGEIINSDKMQVYKGLAIIVGGSNSYFEKLVEDSVFMFKYKYDRVFIWIDVEQLVLNCRVDTRVDEMVNAWLVDEVRQIFIPDADYTKESDGPLVFPEMASYFREEKI
ncbi:hypothetical protein H5410_001646 [Solanum commersonii]|uniref:Uncharacterized protein n=1 Tax=Solanum commersonii TaxID=4109 RepID=A0A9J6AZS1_SOLCO|nr:hypothetical protein H5410_001646 [Solanum commersonii]